MILRISAFLGFISVALAAYAQHGLRPDLSDAVWAQMETALRYHQIHAVIGVAIGLALLSPKIRKRFPRLRWCGWGFLLGILLFSGSIYLSIFANMPGMTFMTPVGGISFMLSWLGMCFIGSPRKLII